MKRPLKKSTIKAKLLVFSMLILLFGGCKPSNPIDEPEDPQLVDSLGISLSSVHYSYDKDASLLVIKTNKSWTATTNAAWLSLSANTGNKNTGILIGASKNDGFMRETSVIIKAGDKSSEIKVVQAGSPTISIRVNNVSFKLILVEGGQYMMGSSTDLNIKYPHLVQLSDFYMAETEATNELWKAVMGSLPYSDHSETDILNMPVSETTWNGITTDFIPALNKATGKTFRLPTEAEWEYAALGGNKTHNYEYAGGAKLDDVAWNYQNANNSKHNVREKLPNELGLYDMSGNVNEWCNDWYHEFYGWPIVNESILIPALETNPKGPSTGTKKVVRGGNFKDESWGLYYKVRYRYSIKPGGYDGCWGNTGNPDEPTCFFSENTGFRLVISD